MERYLFIIFILFWTISVNAQDWERHHKFAKTYFGISNYVIPNLSAGKFLNSNGNIQQFNKNGFISPAINIGATHFWGYADFYVLYYNPLSCLGIVHFFCQEWYCQTLFDNLLIGSISYRVRFE